MLCVHRARMDQLTSSRVFIRPTEYPGLYSVTVSTDLPDAEVDQLINSQDSLIEFIHKGIGRRDLVFGKTIWKTKWR